MTSARRFLRFNAVSAAGFAVQLATVVLCTRWLGTPAVAATVAGVGAALVHNFLCHWQWTWADRLTSRGGVLRAFLGFVAANGLVSLAGNVAIVAAMTHATTLGPVVANVVAVAVCGLLNYQIGNRVVFRAGVVE